MDDIDFNLRLKEVDSNTHPYHNSFNYLSKDESSGYDSNDSNNLSHQHTLSFNKKYENKSFDKIITHKNDSAYREHDNTLDESSFLSEMVNNYNGSVLSSEQFEHPTLEYDESWETTEVVSKEQPHRILMRELSFGDELQDIKGTDLMAPVFLAVTNDEDDDNDDNIRFRRERRVKSIADLCSTTLKVNELHSYRKSKKSKRGLSLNDKLWYSQPVLWIESDFDECSNQVVPSEQTISTHSSCTDLPRCSVASDIYNESIDDSLEDNAILDLFVHNDMYKGEVIHEEDNDLIDEEEIFTKDGFCSSSLLNYDQEVPSTPTKFNGIYDFDLTEDPQTPPRNNNDKAEFLRNINTSPRCAITRSPKKSFDRYIIVKVCGEQRVVDTKLVEPYLRILSHGGYRSVDNCRCVIIVFNAMYLPVITTDKYSIIMEQLFYYCVHALDLLVTDSYEIVFFNSQMKNEVIPPVYFIKKCYEMLNYRLKKQLQHIYFVHQNIWLKTIIQLSQLFASSKFRKKIHVVKNIKELKALVPMEYIYISPDIYRIDAKFH